MSSRPTKPMQRDSRDGRVPVHNQHHGSRKPTSFRSPPSLISEHTGSMNPFCTNYLMDDLASEAGSNRVLCSDLHKTTPRDSISKPTRAPGGHSLSSGRSSIVKRPRMHSWQQLWHRSSETKETRAVEQSWAAPAGWLGIVTLSLDPLPRDG